MRRLIRDHLFATAVGVVPQPGIERHENYLKLVGFEIVEHLFKTGGPDDGPLRRAVVVQGVHGYLTPAALSKHPMSTFVLLIVIALLLSVGALIKPSWPLVPVAVMLVCVALLIGKVG